MFMEYAIRFLVAPALVLAAGACRVADAKVWNLREVHHPDGRAKHVGSLHSDFEHQLRSLLESMRFRAGAAPEEQEEIEDPISECLENLLELSKCNQKDPHLLATTIEMVTWIAGDCEYALSRERCALELADLGELLGINGPLELPPDASPAGPEEVATAIQDLTRDALPALEYENDALRAAPLRERCAEVAELVLDRDGARRLLAVANLLASRGSDQAPSLAPARDLRLDLARRCAGLGLAVLLADPHPRVRGAAFRSSLALSPVVSSERIEQGLSDESPEVKVEAVRALARAGTGVDDGKDERFWTDRLIGLLRQSSDGELSIAICRSLAQRTARPSDLHPENWIAWWEEQEGAGASLP